MSHVSNKFEVYSAFQFPVIHRHGTDVQTDDAALMIQVQSQFTKRPPVHGWPLDGARRYSSRRQRSGGYNVCNF